MQQKDEIIQPEYIQYPGSSFNKMVAPLYDMRHTQFSDKMEEKTSLKKEQMQEEMCTVYTKTNEKFSGGWVGKTSWGLWGT